MKFETRIIQAAETIDLRHRVLWPDMPRGHVVLPQDGDATHFGAFLDRVLGGVGSFFKQGTAYQLRKLAVAHEFQGCGVASVLLGHAIEYLQTQGCNLIWCDARLSAADFYRKNGFVIEAEVFQKQGLDYVIAKRWL